MSLTSAPSRSLEVCVLDSWPILEHILRAALISRLDTLLEKAANAEAVLLMSEINLGEVFYRIAKESSEAYAERSLTQIARLPIRIMPVTEGDVLRAARLKARHAISYADSFCAALAVAHQAPVLTGDPDFLLLERRGLLRLEWVGA